MTGSMWMEMPAPYDEDEFPEGGMWLCCGKLEKEAERCSIGTGHEAAG